MSPNVTLESEEWYVLCNWLRVRENESMYALRSRSKEWEVAHELRRSIQDQRGDAEETGGTLQTVTLTTRELSYLTHYLARRARLLRFKPWRDRERRDVLRLRQQIVRQG